MAGQAPKILLTGSPGCGKTTAVMRITETLQPAKLAGFYTRQIRQNSKRPGFRWIRLDGEFITRVKKMPPVSIFTIDRDSFDQTVEKIVSVFNL